ncbi:Kynurenine formamidase [Tardiphaga sp. OK246]|uniref:cyclase family protein n=1 Tax=Tardiphaga sp. OK246 TaxID=1855307 RepID=UPI000B68BC56|nr:cyclase family protein [Tardiphaga sp. OK246]SNT32139.1 Kynurenine formamidase [Tardiphaga sp. OK246]
MRVMDISVPIENDVASDPPFARPRIAYLDHSMTIDRMQAFFPDLDNSKLPDGAAWAMEKVELTTHNGTHLDAPYHFHPTMNHALKDGGERSLTIDEVPLEWCFQRGVKLDFRSLADGYVATADDVETELRRIGHDLQPLDIVVVNTRAGERLGQADYVSAGCGVGREATLFLTERGVKITGTDAWSWDAPFEYTAKRVAETQDYGLVWEGHKAGRERAYCHIEKLHNLEKLPPSGFRIACFPVKIRAASAGWTRAVAIFDDQ